MSLCAQVPEKLRIVTPGSGKQGAAKKARVHPPTVHKTPRVVSAPTEDSPSPPRPFDTEGVEVRQASAALRHGCLLLSVDGII